MLRQFLKRLLPSQTSISRFSTAQRFAPMLVRPEIWAINRRSIALGMAVGLFVAMIPGPVQILCAMGIAIFLRVNLPMAVIATLLTNPLTMLPIYYVAHQIGTTLIGVNEQFADTELALFSYSDWTRPLEMLSICLDAFKQLGKPLLLGLGLLTLILPLLGYCAVQLVWRVHLVYALHRRRYRRRHPQRVRDAIS